MAKFRLPKTSVKIIIRYMRDHRPLLVYRILQLALITLVTQMAVAVVTAQTPPQITAHDRELAQRMLSQVHQTLKQNYYDPTFHGIDVDERFKKYSAEIKSANTFQTAYRTIESFLTGLNDSHTIFLPPPNSNRVTYRFRIKMIGDQCLGPPSTSH